MKQEPVRYLGVVSSVLAKPGWDGFAVVRLRVQMDNGEWREVSLVDRLVAVSLRDAVGGWVCFEGVEETHPKYGRQVRVTRGPIPLPNPRVVFAGLQMEEVPSSMVGRARLTLGAELVAEDVFAGSPDRLASAIGEVGAQHLVSAWSSFVLKCRVADAARDAGVSGVVSLALQRVDVGELADDPWSLLDIEGADPIKVERFVSLLGGKEDPEGRLRAILLFALRRAAARGHSHLPLRQLYEVVCTFAVSSSTDSIIAALASLRDAGVVVVDRDTVPGTPMVYDSRIYRVEQGAAEILASRCGVLDPPEWLLQDLAKNRESLGLSDLQVDAVRCALSSSVSAITGLPGTGKTTSLRALVDFYEREGRKVLLVAPTGVAARRLKEATGRDASTIHRAFAGRVEAERQESSYVGVVGTTSKQPGIPDPDGVWGHGAASPHEATAIIVDESSMLDEHLFYRILDGTMAESRLVLVGDPAQLPPVGPGSVLEDVVRCGHVPHVHLTEIFRQAAKSPVIRAAHEVFRGEVPRCRVVSAQEAAASQEEDFLLVRATSEEEAQARILDIAARVYGQPGTCQVLSPRHAGPAGVTALNVALRARVNPPVEGRAEIQVGSHLTREGDRVMVIENNYDHGVFNGEVGDVLRISAGRVGIMIHGNPPISLDLDPKTMGKMIRLAYAVTVHKSQGLEYDTVILPVLSAFGAQVTRRLFYTAITRARRVILVGQESAVADAVRRDGGEVRHGLLEARIRRLFGERFRA